MNEQWTNRIVPWVAPVALLIIWQVSAQAGWLSFEA